MPRASLAAITLVLGLALAATGDARADDPPVVDVADLPALPRVDDTDTAGRLAVVSAAAAEEDVITGAAKREQSLGNVASAVTVISGDRLRRFGYRTVADALRAVAGLYVLDDRMIDRVGVRGLQLLGDFNTRMLVVIDGATINEPWNQYAGVGWDLPVTIDDIARIEVIRGPVSSLYGTNAFFGIINIVTRGATEVPRAWGRVSGGAFGTASANAGFATGDINHQLRGSVGTLYRRGETLVLPDLGGEIDSDGEQALVAGLVGAYQGAFAQVRFYRRIRELPGAPFEAEPGDARNRNHDTQLLAEGGYTRDLGRRITVTGRAYVSRYRFEDFLIYDPDPFQDFGDSFWYGAELRGRWGILPKDVLGITAGGEITFVDTESRSYSVGMEDDGVFVPTAMTLQGLYAELDGAPLSWLAFTGGVRLDRNSLLEDRASPRAALFLSAGDRAGAKILYAEGFRNPSALEAFFDDTTDYAANPDLRAEIIRSGEIVLWGRPIIGLSARLSGFWWESDRLIELEEVVLEGDQRLQFQNRGALRSQGIEIEASYRNSLGWLAFAGGTLARVRDLASDEAAINAPAVTATAGVSTPLLAGLGHLGAELSVVGPRLTRDPDRDASTFVAANAVLYIPDLHGFDLTLGVRNLIGRREDVPVQEDYDRSDSMLLIPILPGEGREIHARVGYRY